MSPGTSSSTRCTRRSEALAAQIVTHRDATGVPIAVLTVSSTDGVPIDRYAHDVAEAWAGGSANRADGVLFVLAIDDRTNRFETGGLAPAYAWYGPPGAQVTPSYLSSFTLGGLLTFLFVLVRTKTDRPGVLGAATWGTWLITPVIIGVFFWEGAGFWWAYPAVYLAVDLAAAPLVFPRGIDVLALLEYHFKVFGFLIAAAPIVMLLITKSMRGETFGGGGSCAGSFPLPGIGFVFGMGSSTSVQRPERREIGGTKANRQSWRGGGKRWGRPGRDKDRFRGGGASSSW